VTDTLELSAKRIAEQGRDELVSKLRPAFAEAASAHADVLKLDSEQIEQMVQRAADRADGLQWRRALASVAAKELGIGLGEALGHPAVQRAQAMVGAPSYEESLASLMESPEPNGNGKAAEPEAVAPEPPPAPAAPEPPPAPAAPEPPPAPWAPTPAPAAQAPTPAPAAQAPAPAPPAPAPAPRAPAASPAPAEPQPPAPATAAAARPDATRVSPPKPQQVQPPKPQQGQPPKPQPAQPRPQQGSVRPVGAPRRAPEPPPIRVAAIHLGGVTDLRPGEGEIELRLSDHGLDITRGTGEVFGRLTWQEIHGLEVPPLRGFLRRRREPRAHLVVRAEHGDASFEIPAVTPEELRQHLQPLLERHGHGSALR
jgi:hypothetical protein